MKDWKNLKDKEIIIGLIIIIVLGSIALFLLIRREISYYKEMPIIKEAVLEENSEYLEDEGTAKEENLQVTEVAATEVVEAEVKNEAEELLIDNVQIVTETTKEEIVVESKEEIGLYDILGEEKYQTTALVERKQEDNQLKELYEYWDAYKLDAVAELVRLERLQKVSEELKGTNKYYYYGSVDRIGRPSGNGLAVYADNTYYCGEWKEGLRHGKGMWMQVVIYTEENKAMNKGVIEHSYNGQWSKDLPNGEGQEHFSYDYDVLSAEDTQNNECIANVIGGFKDGYYHGEMYIMTTDKMNNTKDWSGICKNGIWESIVKGNTTEAVWQAYEKDAGGNTEYHYIFPKDNQNYGIIGLKK